jgi:hypothetical protein
MATTPRSNVDASSSIAAVQQEVIDSFREADANVGWHTTGYFNHTYVPDIVLRWENQKEERHVFLRASDNQSYLREDIDLLSEKDPIFVPLHGLERRALGDGDAAQGSVEAGALQEASVSAHALITQPESIRALGQTTPQAERINALTARALLQGGAGVVTPDFASSFNEVVAGGFRGALVGDEAATSDALRLTFDVLDTERTAQLAELLQAAWIGGGQVSSSFPGLGFPGSPLEPEALLLLLDTVSVDDADFWQRLARNLQMKHFAGITIAAQHDGFQQLMRAAAPRLKAKAARTVGVDASENTNEAVWALNKGVLSLGLGRARVDFAASSVKDFGVEGYEATPSVHSFVKRAKDADLNVLRVVLSNGDRSLEYVSKDGTSVVDDARIQDIANDFDGSTVARAVVAAEGRDLGINLESSTGSGHTRSIFHVSTLAQSLLPLVLELNTQEQDELQAIFAEQGVVADDSVPPQNETNA